MVSGFSYFSQHLPTESSINCRHCFFLCCTSNEIRHSLFCRNKSYVIYAAEAAFSNKWRRKSTNYYWSTYSQNI